MEADTDTKIQTLVRTQGTLQRKRRDCWSQSGQGYQENIVQKINKAGS